MNSNIFFLILATEFQANHNKDYSVVKTLGSFPLPLAAGFFIMIDVEHAGHHFPVSRSRKLE